MNPKGNEFFLNSRRKRERRFPRTGQGASVKDFIEGK